MQPITMKHTFIAFGLLALAVPTAHAGLPVPASVVQFLTDTHYQLPAENEPASGIVESLNPQFIGGKRLRPLLCFLSAGVLGIEPKAVLRLACLTEQIHQASLAHDDVIDASTQRRDQPSLWNRTDTTTAVLLGDWLLAEAVNSAAETGSLAAVRAITRAIKEMTRGEVIQRQAIEHGDYEYATWNRVADAKTGALFVLALSLPAVRFHAPQPILDTYRELGLTMGRLFQLQDDIGDAKEERGEMNLVLWHASRAGKVGPFSNEISPAMVDVGLQRVEKTLRARTEDLAQLLAQLREQSEAMREIRRVDGQAFADECLNSFKILSKLLTAMPR